jgi:cytochrome c oxidase assembly factor CtaG
VRKTALFAGVVMAATAAVTAFVSVMWLWHIPALYDLTLRDDAVHNLEHTAFFAVGLLFWTAALPSRGRAPSLGLIGRAAVVLTGLVGSWMLAVFIGYAPTVLYAYSGSGGLTPLADQQLAAGVMWVPASLPFVIVLVALGARWLENDATAAAAAGLIAAVRLETIRAIRTTFNADHRQDDDGCRLGIGVDIFAAARRTRLIGKLDDFAHCETPFRPGAKSAGSVLLAIKGRTGLTVC